LELTAEKAEAAEQFESLIKSETLTEELSITRAGKNPSTSANPEATKVVTLEVLGNGGS
jgi:hypothetical protein